MTVMEYREEMVKRQVLGPQVDSVRGQISILHGDYRGGGVSLH